MQDVFYKGNKLSRWEYAYLDCNGGTERTEKELKEGKRIFWNDEIEKVPAPLPPDDTFWEYSSTVSAASSLDRPRLSEPPDFE